VYGESTKGGKKERIGRFLPRIRDTRFPSGKIFTMKAIDTSRLLRFLTWDDEEKAGEVMRAIEEEGIFVCGEVIMETVYVLMSKRQEYRKTKQEVIEILEQLFSHPQVEVEDDIYLEALEVWKESNVDKFSDVVIVLKAIREERELFTFDKEQRKLFEALS